MTMLAIEKIRTDGGTQIRTETNVTQAESYVEDMAAGDVFPPIVAFFDGAEYWLGDGFHRLIAAKSLGLAEIDTDVRAGTRRDAILYAVGANASHGLKRTNSDKRNAVMTLLRDPEWSQWVDGEIARRCAVNDKTVAKYRAEVAPRISGNSGDSRTVTRGGTTYTMNTSAIGARPAPSPQPEPREWRQTDIEEFTRPAPVPLHPRHIPNKLAGGAILQAVERIVQESAKVTPAEAVAAVGGELWTDAEDAEKAISWLTEFVRLVPNEMSRRETTQPHLAGYRRRASGG